MATSMTVGAGLVAALGRIFFLPKFVIGGRRCLTTRRTLGRRRI